MILGNFRQKRYSGWLGKRCSPVRSLPILILSVVLFFPFSGTTLLCHAAGEPNEIRVGEIAPPQWQTYFWQVVGIFGVLVLIAVT